MKSLREIWEEAHLASTKLDTFFDTYEELFAGFRSQNGLTIVELGVLHGGSLEMWRKYFSSETSRVIGIDKNPVAADLAGADFEVFTADQCSVAGLDNLFQKIGPVDVIIDDGAHTNLATVTSLITLWKWIKPGGFYIIEDTHTSHHQSFGNPSRQSIFEFACNIAAAQSQLYLLGKSRIATSPQWIELAQNFESVRFYPSMIVMRAVGENQKGRVPKSIGNGRVWSEKNGDFRDVGSLSKILDGAAGLFKQFFTAVQVKRLGGFRRKVFGKLVLLRRRRENRFLARQLRELGFGKKPGGVREAYLPPGH